MVNSWLTRWRARRPRQYSTAVGPSSSLKKVATPRKTSSCHGCPSLGSDSHALALPGNCAGPGMVESSWQTPVLLAPPAAAPGAGSALDGHEQVEETDARQVPGPALYAVVRRRRCRGERNDRMQQRPGREDRVGLADQLGLVGEGNQPPRSLSNPGAANVARRLGTGGGSAPNRRPATDSIRKRTAFECMMVAGVAFGGSSKE